MSGDSAMVRNKALIINNLSVLAKERCMISAALGGKDTLLTSIVNVNQKTGRVIFDTSPSAVLNAKVLSTKTVRFSAIFNGVQVAFSGSDVEKTKHGGYDAFVMAMPDSLYWYDRRNAYRIKTPIMNRAICKMRLTPPDDELKEESKPEYKINYATALKKINVRMLEHIEKFLLAEQKAFDRAFLRLSPEDKEVAKEEREALLEERKINPIVPDEESLNVFEMSMFDLSMTGCSAINVDSEFSCFLQPGTKYENCVIVMPDHGEVVVSMEVMMQRVIESDEIKQDDSIEEFIGLKFYDATQTAESIIFRYIQLLDRIAKKKN